MYAIAGATGNTGRIVAETLLAAGKKVRALGRSEDRLKDIASKGAEPFAVDVTDTVRLTEALKGSEAAYVLMPPKADAPDLRAYQDGVSKSWTRAIKDSGVGYVVNLSSMGAHLSEGVGPVSGLHYFEQRLNELDDLNVLHLRPTFFMENLFTSLEPLKQFGVLGSLTRPDIKVPLIASRDVGDYAAERLLKLDFSGKSTRELWGERDISMAEVTRIIGEAIGNANLQYVQFPPAEVKQSMLANGFSESYVDALLELYEATHSGLMVSEEERSAENTTRTSIEEFAQVFAAVYKGN